MKHASARRGPIDPERFSRACNHWNTSGGLVDLESAGTTPTRGPYNAPVDRKLPEFQREGKRGARASPPARGRGIRGSPWVQWESHLSSRSGVSPELRGQLRPGTGNRSRLPQRGSGTSRPYPVASKNPGLPKVPGARSLDRATIRSGCGRRVAPRSPARKPVAVNQRRRSTPTRTA
jgi:hypothetical protein